MKKIILSLAVIFFIGTSVVTANAVIPNTFIIKAPAEDVFAAVLTILDADEHIWRAPITVALTINGTIAIGEPGSMDYCSCGKSKTNDWHIDGWFEVYVFGSGPECRVWISTKYTVDLTIYPIVDPAHPRFYQRTCSSTGRFERQVHQSIIEFLGLATK